MKLYLVERCDNEPYENNTNTFAVEANDAEQAQRLVAGLIAHHGRDGFHDTYKVAEIIATGTLNITEIE